MVGRISFKGHIGHAVWLYFRFTLSFRDVEELLAERGIVVTYETIRQWCQKFGQAYANGVRRRRRKAGDRWHLDEVFLVINACRQYLLMTRPITASVRHAQQERRFKKLS